MKDDLRAEPDLDLDLDDDRVYRPAPRKTRSANWLAWQIALGIIVGGCVLWTLDLAASLVASKFMLGQLQIGVPGFSR